MNKNLKILYVDGALIAIGNNVPLLVLKYEKHTVTATDDGKHAIEFYLNNDFDLIFLGIQINTLDGLSVAKKIRGFEKELKKKYTPIIAMSVNENKDFYIQSGFDNLLNPKCSRTDVINIIDETLYNKAVNLKEIKRIELKDEEYWMLGFEEVTEDVEYIVPDIELKQLVGIAFCDGVYGFAEHTIVNAPNLKEIYIQNYDKIAFSNSINKLLSSFNTITSFSIFSQQLIKIPDFILKNINLTRLELDICNEITEIPPEIFKFKQLKILEFRYKKNIKVIPDEIKNLENLERFNLWSATFEYISPELFKLPKLQSVSFSYCQYNPTNEVLELLRENEINKKFSISSQWSNYKLVTKEELPIQKNTEVKEKAPYIHLTDNLAGIIITATILIVLINIECDDFFIYMMPFAAYVLFRLIKWID